MLIFVPVQFFFFFSKRNDILGVRIILESQNLGIERCGCGEDRKPYFYFFSGLERILFNLRRK